MKNKNKLIKPFFYSLTFLVIVIYFFFFLAPVKNAQADPSADVETVAIMAPTGTVSEGANIIPRATVRNNGTSAATFTVACWIGSGYYHTQTVIALAPGDSQQVDFSSWTAEPLGSQAVRFTTQLLGDEVPANDTLTGTVYIASSCTTPTDGATYSSDTTFCSGTYNLPNGISVGASGITLTGDNTTLVGGTTGNGINTGYGNVIIQNLNVRGYANAINIIGLSSGDSLTLTNLNLSNLSGASGNGVYTWNYIGGHVVIDGVMVNNRNRAFNFDGLTSPATLTISNSTASNNVIGLYTVGGNNFNLTNNIFSNNSQYGVNLNMAINGLVFTGNTVTNNTYGGLLLGPTSGTRTFSNNTIASNGGTNGFGIYLVGNQNGLAVTPSWFKSPAADNFKNNFNSIHLESANNLTIGDPANELVLSGPPGSTTGGGIRFDSPNNNNIVIDNVRVENKASGILLGGGGPSFNNLVIRNSNFSNNSQYGVVLTALASLEFTGNIINNNIYGGLLLGPTSGTRTFSNNTIASNGGTNGFGIYFIGNQNGLAIDNSWFKSPATTNFQNNFYSLYLDQASNLNIGDPANELVLSGPPGSTTGGGIRYDSPNNNNIVIDNVRVENKASGIWVGSAGPSFNNLVIRDSNFSNNSHYGINLASCHGGVIENNTVCNNPDADIYLDAGSNNNSGVNTKCSGVSDFGNSNSVSCTHVCSWVDVNNGNDIIYGGPGDDIINGGYGDDTLYSGPGTDTLNGEEGSADVCNGNSQTVFANCETQNINQ